MAPAGALMIGVRFWGIVDFKEPPKEYKQLLRFRYYHRILGFRVCWYCSHQALRVGGLNRKCRRVNVNLHPCACAMINAALLVTTAVTKQQQSRRHRRSGCGTRTIVARTMQYRDLNNN